MPGKVKAEGVKKEKVKEEKKNTGEQARVSEPDEGNSQEDIQQEDEADPSVNEDDAAENDEDDEEQGSPRSAKRARVNDDGDAIPGSSQPQEPPRPRPVTLPRDTDGYVPGSIVRIKLHNFVTYDDVEFRPGPYLNMVLGPNGTGKSSIACAICLGLNFPPSVLGRASELNSFVKHGYETGFIEIELKGAKGQSNVVIRRNLKATSKGTTFELNGAQVPGKEVNARVSALNVQCTNLCTFLPQDKVAEFAQMTPQQLLAQTQLAAGDQNLTTWHETLKKAGVELKKMTEAIDKERLDLATLEQRNSILERDVQQYKQRREIERKVELLELLLPFKEYLESKVLYEERKRKRQDLHAKTIALAEKNKPVHDFKANLDKKQKSLEKDRDTRKKAAQSKFLSMKSKWQANERYEQENEDIATKLDNLKTEEATRKNRIASHTREIHKIEQELAHPPETEDLGVIDEDRKTNSEKVHKARRDREAVEMDMRRIADESAKQKAIVSKGLNDIANLDNVSHRRLADLSKWNKDCAEIVHWLRKNQTRFRMPVIEPAVISLSVPDAQYCDAVEACFNVNQITSFVAQCAEDYNLLNHVLADTGEALGRKVNFNSWFRPKTPNQLLPPPMSAEEMQQLGFDAYVIDLIECPDGLLWFLQSELNFHRTAVGKEGRVDVAHAMEAVSRFGPRGEGGGASFVAGRTLNRVQRSRYGKRAPQNTMREIRKARNLAFPPVDQALKSSIDRSIAEARSLADEAEEEIKKLQAQMTDKEARFKELQKEKAEIDDRRKAVLDARKRIESLGHKLTTLAEKLKLEEEKPSVAAERDQLRKKVLEVAKKRAAIAKDLKGIIQSVIKEQTEATRFGLECIQISANKTALEDLIHVRDQEYAKAKADFAEADVVYTESKVDTKEKLRISKAKLESIDDELRRTFEKMDDTQEIHQRDAEEIRQELADQKAKLELNSATNAGVIEQYERRQQEIDDLRVKITAREDRKNATEKSIRKTKDKWLPALQALVASIGEKFSAAFERVGCAGEVRLGEQEDDFEKWTIEILVKFRDTERLQLLTGTRQSGGERALTTIMYLMSLTEQARAPFSLVDEINQGMDAQYERAVHNSLVDVTCKPDNGQYFLITPKLLTDLKYHERMKVLCVNNGEWLPEEDGRLDGNMMKMIDNYVARRR
ncbi:P-loop containing nucleoside triphosphate hydrolase protein [Rickenella mellea]|uniref:Structural maintenance of chromosomes protein 5 n=1 Tax=Rickenella mellea TaxID=50990 RepID=A0A4R5XHE7_9AGAM|nr:P-loop containing nucleoside triphosphate hydrolase protein [Rickenella mellea]